MKEPIILSLPVGYLQTNCYLVSDGFICVVIDPGGSAEKIKAKIREMGWHGVAVLLTHGHFDHILALNEFSKEGYKVYVHEEDEIMLKDNDKNLVAMMGLPPIPVVKADGLLKDGQDISFGELTFRVIHTPGHTPGSCCFDLDKKYLFSGDTLFYHSHGRTDFLGGNGKDMVASLQKLFLLEGDRTVFPGHNEQTDLDDEREFFGAYYG